MSKPMWRAAYLLSMIAFGAMIPLAWFLAVQSLGEMLAVFGVAAVIGIAWGILAVIGSEDVAS